MSCLKTHMHCILSPHQHSFIQKNHFCQTQLIGFIEDIQFATDNYQQVDILVATLTQLSKAFTR